MNLLQWSRGVQKNGERLADPSQAIRESFKRDFEKAADKIDGAIKSVYNGVAVQTLAAERKDAEDYLKEITDKFPQVLEIPQQGLARLWRSVNNPALIANRSSALLAASIINYVDDFLDTKLWPTMMGKGMEHERKGIETKTSRLFAVIQAMMQKEFSVYLPGQIVRLQELELSLELDPSQENFDKNIEEFLLRKSASWLYIDTALRNDGRASQKDIDAAFTALRNPKFRNGPDWNAYVAQCCRDMLPSFQPKHDAAPDFKLRRFLLQHPDIDPKVLEEYVSKVMQRLLEKGRGATEKEREDADVIRQFLGQLRKVRDDGAKTNLDADIDNST